MITIKTKREIELMREAGKIVALAHEEVKRYIKAGVTTRYLDAICEKVILDHDATPSFKGLNGYPAATCISVNDVCQHGIPSDKCLLEEGDVLSIDIGACFKGYHGDSAWTYAIGNISEEAEKLLNVTQEALYLGLKQAKAGNRVQDISYAIGTHLLKNGYTTPLEFTGHGIGMSVHEDPSVPNYGQAGKGIMLKAGMTVAIEPIAHLGKPQIIILADGWTAVTKDKSITAHFEHTVLIEAGECTILTKIV